MVIVATDLIGLPREVSDEVAARAKKKYGLERGQLMLNSLAHAFRASSSCRLRSSSRTSVPAIGRRLIDYRDRLVDDLVEVVGAALADLRPATLAVGHGSAAFAMNRRQPTEQRHPDWRKPGRAGRS